MRVTQKEEEESAETFEELEDVEVGEGADAVHREEVLVQVCLHPLPLPTWTWMNVGGGYFPAHTVLQPSSKSQLTPNEFLLESLSRVV